MNAGYIVLIVFGSLALLLVLLLLSRVGLRVYYNANESGVKISWLFIRKKLKIDDASRLLDRRKKEKEPDETKKTDKEPSPEETPEKKIPLSWQIDRITGFVSRIAERLHGTLTLRARRIVVTVATGDAAKTALLYGAVSAALAGFVEFLDRTVAPVRTKARDEIDVRAGFLGSKSSADIDLVLSTRVLGALRVLFTLLTSHDSPKKKKGKKKTKKPVKADRSPTAIPDQTE